MTNAPIGPFPPVGTPANTSYRPALRSTATSWFEALAAAWGEALDRQATEIETQSNLIGVDGSDRPSDVAMLTAQAQRMSFISNSASSSIDSVGRALETMARKG